MRLFFLCSAHLVPVYALHLSRRALFPLVAPLSLPSQSLAACLPGDTNVKQCLGTSKDWGRVDGDAVRMARRMSTEEMVRDVAADVGLVRSWRSLVGASDWQTLGKQILDVTPRVRVWDVFCDPLVLRGSGDTQFGVLDASVSKRVAACRSSFDLAYEALASLEDATAMAFRQKGRSGEIERQLAVFQAQKYAEQRFNAVAAAMGVDI